ncbi:hypothetical protein SAMN04487939_1101 [Lysobacter sp. yr284]|uniref:hypothetical protein n=1 Tax=Lysobacter sp. yr284 TaxID=1761791 RepID=UPI0008974EBA|nr:hypothetical protein [Lysobacter sp. yr284]SDY95316.1 hypothetical protein SAMN04487939_1101 [Lysobacter sp. yr284]
MPRAASSSLILAVLASALLAPFAAAALEPAVAKPDAAASAGGVGATARAVSAGIVAGIRQGAQQDRNAKPAQIACVRALAYDAVAAPAQQVIEASLDAQDRAYLETFYASPLGVKYQAAMLSNADPDKAFSAEEWTQAQAAMASPAYQKLRAATVSSNPLAAQKIGGTLNPLLGACFKDADGQGGEAKGG